jgi:hypothetical protein
MMWARYLKLFAKLGVTALVPLATARNAQIACEGKFTLEFSR